MKPRKRIKDVYDLINAPDDEREDAEIPKVQIGNIDIGAAIKAKLQKYSTNEVNVKN